ncbi:molecular chaperone HtpG [Candidatus Margulisiibacteriota bacterium]
MTNKYEFKTEVKELLDIVIHSLYSHREIFLRELISNASDAIDRLRFLSLTDKSLKDIDTNWKIKIDIDKKNNMITISDNGIGMTKEELIDHIGTIARSGTKEFLEAAKKAQTNPELIGQFGVGFYASFMVAEKVDIITQCHGQKAYKWSSTGDGSFEIEETTKEKNGTDVIIKLNNDAQQFMEEFEIRNVVKKYSDFIEHPIVMNVEREEIPKDKDGKPIEGAKAEKKIVEEVLNSQKAIWTKQKSKIKKEEYTEFYKHISHDYQEPLEIIHFHAEGKQEFKALLFIPQRSLSNLYQKDSYKGIHLYIKRVLIMDDCTELIPEYLRFMFGIVDSSDLPLNVSRETIQQNVQLEKIKKNLIKKILKTITDMKNKEYEKYLTFYKSFGPILKEGIHFDHENKDALIDLILFETTLTEPGKYKSLQEYSDTMPEEQSEIYYITGENRENIISSPHLEAFKDKKYEVLLMTDPIDEWVVSSLSEYKGKKLKSITKGDIELKDEEKEKAKEKHKDLLGYMKDILEEDITEVTFSSRLKESACCLVEGEQGMSKQMEKMFQSMGQITPKQKKILELNPKHPIIELLQKSYEKNKEDNKIKEYTELLYDQAIVAEGGKVSDPIKFTKKISKLMVEAAQKNITQ